VGLVTTVGHFYDGPLSNHNKLWADSKILAIEMEISILLVIASIRGIRAGTTPLLLFSFIHFVSFYFYN
jgi:uridine phosphorylase